jgi:rRNA biogenesis protein RRP5
MGKKRDLEEKSTQTKTKKIKLDNKDNSQKPTVQADDVDFPRGGGTTFTPLEVKTLRAEAVKEADTELFGVRVASAPNTSMLLTRICSNRSPV